MDARRSRRTVCVVRLAAWLAAGGILFACSSGGGAPADDGSGDGSVDPEAESRELLWDEGVWDEAVWG